LQASAHLRRAAKIKQKRELVLFYFYFSFIAIVQAALEDSMLTVAVSVAESDAVDIQWHCQVDGPPRVCLRVGMRTG